MQIAILIYPSHRGQGLKKADLPMFLCIIYALEGAPEVQSVSERDQNLGIDPRYRLTPTVLLGHTTSALPDRCQ